MKLSLSSVLGLALAGIGILSVGCSGSSSNDTATGGDQAFTETSSSVKLSKDDDGKIVKVKPGADVVLSLSQNGSTGYVWMIKTNDLGEPETHFKAPTPDVPGDSGTTTFTWKTPGATGSHTLELVLQRPWAETSPAVDSFSVTLDFDANPQQCGGLLGATCSDQSTYCAYASGCGANDGSGVCTPRPQFCPRIESPVCGCDGQTYSNGCEAAQAGVTIKFHGPCALP